MASDAPLNPYRPPLNADAIDAATLAETAAPTRPWGPWATLEAALKAHGVF